MSPALAAAESACAAWAQSDGPLALRVGSYDAVIIRAAGEAAIASQRALPYLTVPTSLSQKRTSPPLS